MGETIIGCVCFHKSGREMMKMTAKNEKLMTRKRERQGNKEKLRVL